MTAVIVGLVAVVLLVLLVVALGMRSMNRRESALSAERIKAMAENKGPKPRRPAEETFFESFPKGFDAFEEPEKQRPAPRPAPRPGGRQAARPAQRGGKQPAAARGKRGVDEWGEADDYDDDYWSRVRADDGGFGGTIAAKMATPRPVDETPGAPRATDPDAATMQAPLPARPSRPRRAGAEEPVLPSAPVPASALADQKTVTFSAPTPDLLDASAAPAGSPSTGPFDASRTTGPFDSPAASDPLAGAGTQAGTPGASSRRPSRSGRSSRAATRRAAAAAAAGETGQAGGSYDSRRTTGSFPSSPSAGSYGTQPAADPLGIATSTGPFGAPAYDTPAGTGPFAAQGGAGSPDVHAAGGYDTAASSPNPATGPFATGSYDPARTSGAFEAVSADALADPAPRSTGGSFDAWAASYETPRSDAYDPAREATGPFRAAEASPSYPPNPAGAGLPGPGAAVTGPDAGGAAEPGWPVAGTYPPVPAASAPTTGSSSWPNAARDVLDDPEPPRGASSWPNAETYQTPSYDGYSSAYPASESGYPAAAQPPPAAPATPSYEVSTGWATIDASDTVTGSAAGTASPYESAGYDAPSGQSQYGYDRQQQQGYGGAQPSWPEQEAGGSWPSYDEVYDDTSTSAGGRRRGNHRNPESDYPDYYR
ncbi:hypothetical protein SAMN05421833_10773 [Microbispora rosea]|uniref:Uncharacterized protein n=1 Tax=Microbispora rosea TaxID=58117 RepID=A0A1N6ZB96_9ACTN|nr:hypothetical protein [Microbispora rosea]GIH47599.1 hypothetical protein Mro03_27780 [Microbispora rosea subsp. rosea]SIR24172.1 hypothetical protein SAMN05421833_10773 [Microbispora rosea]